MPELVCVLAIPLLIVAAILWSMLGGLAEARHARLRWGSRRVSYAPRGEGAYRESGLSSTVPRSMPLPITLTGVSGLGLAMLTGLVFAPMGLLMSGLMFGPVAVHQPWATVEFVGSLSGLLLALTLHDACRSLLRSERDAGPRAQRVAVYSLVHHAVMSTLFLFGSFYRPGDLLVLSIPALMGLTHAVMLFFAGRRARHAHSAMSPREKAELPALGS